MKQHPLSAIFPPLVAEEFDALAADIKRNGLRTPIVVFEHQVLDGWHRYQACQKHKVTCRQIEYKGKDPAGFVRSHNFLRRHLTASQRAAAVVALNEWTGIGANQHRGSAPGADPKSAPGAELQAKSAEQMARDAGVSVRTIEQAKVVEKLGSKAVKKAVHDGQMSVKAAAAEVTGKPKSEPKPTVPADVHAALVEKHKELIGELETYTAISNDEAVKEMNLLRQLLAQAQRARDDYMREAKEKGEQIKRLERELKRLGWKGWGK